ncbi:hypothetical protein NQD34_001168 [Periophthalmus magnuspinnatus]|nr:hypothetical protein NQD34_001168 [Periophthalmus magnuspinnatus]
MEEGGNTSSHSELDNYYYGAEPTPGPDTGEVVGTASLAPLIGGVTVSVIVALIALCVLLLWLKYRYTGFYSTNETKEQDLDQDSDREPGQDQDPDPGRDQEEDQEVDSEKEAEEEEEEEEESTQPLTNGEEDQGQSS